MNKHKEYKPISCDFYDIIEIHAMRKREVQLRFRDVDGVEQRIITVIKDTLVRDKEEFIILAKAPFRVRMDRIVAIDDHVAGHFC